MKTTVITLADKKHKLIVKMNRKPVLQTLAIASHLSNKKRMPVQNIKY